MHRVHSANSVVVAATPRPSSSDTVSVNPGARTSDRTRAREIVPGADDDEIPHQGEPRRGHRPPAPRSSGIEQQFGVVLDRLLLLRIAAAQQPQQPAVAANRLAASGSGGFMRVPPCAAPGSRARDRRSLPGAAPRRSARASERRQREVSPPLVIVARAACRTPTIRSSSSSSRRRAVHRRRPDADVAIGAGRDLLHDAVAVRGPSARASRMCRTLGFNGSRWSTSAVCPA